MSRAWFALDQRRGRDRKGPPGVRAFKRVSVRLSTWKARGAPAVGWTLMGARWSSTWKGRRSRPKLFQFRAIRAGPRQRGSSINARRQVTAESLRRLPAWRRLGTYNACNSMCSRSDGLIRVGLRARGMAQPAPSLKVASSHVSSVKVTASSGHAVLSSTFRQ